MKIDEHHRAFKEHLQSLQRSIDEGIEENQRNIGYNISQGSIELFAIHLHTLHLIEGSGDQWDHRWFKSRKKMMLKIPSSFPNQEKTLTLLETIERERNVLCYGRRKPKNRIEQMILAFQELRKIIPV